jgi:hypothetical protein
MLSRAVLLVARSGSAALHGKRHGSNGVARRDTDETMSKENVEAIRLSEAGSP